MGQAYGRQITPHDPELCERGVRVCFRLLGVFVKVSHFVSVILLGGVNHWVTIHLELPDAYINSSGCLPPPKGQSDDLVIR